MSGESLTNDLGLAWIGHSLDSFCYSIPFCTFLLRLAFSSPTRLGKYHALRGKVRRCPEHRGIVHYFPVSSIYMCAKALTKRKCWPHDAFAGVAAAAPPFRDVASDIHFDKAFMRMYGSAIRGMGGNGWLLLERFIMMPTSAETTSRPLRPPPGGQTHTPLHGRPALL